MTVVMITPLPRRTTIIGAGLLLLTACGKDPVRDLKSLKTQVQYRYGKKDFVAGYDLAKKGFEAARSMLGDKAPDTLYFAQAVSENALGKNDIPAAMKAMKVELDLRSKAGQAEDKLQRRRTLLIKLAEENGDKPTSIEQTVIIAKSIGMSAGKDPQPTYRPESPYPADLAKARVEGDVEIGFNLDPTGAPQGLQVIRAVPANTFDIAAMENFRRWRFTPFIENGQPVSSAGHKFMLAFRLEKAARPAGN